MHVCSVAHAVAWCLSICHNMVYWNDLSWFLALRLPLAYIMLCFKWIWVPPKIRVLLSGIFVCFFMTGASVITLDRLLQAYHTDHPPLFTTYRQWHKSIAWVVCYRWIVWPLSCTLSCFVSVTFRGCILFYVVFFVVNCVWKGIGVMESKRNNKSLGFFANIYGGVGHSAAWWPAGWVHHWSISAYFLHWEMTCRMHFIWSHLCLQSASKWCLFVSSFSFLFICMLLMLRSYSCNSWLQLIAVLF